MALATIRLVTPASQKPAAPMGVASLILLAYFARVSRAPALG